MSSTKTNLVVSSPHMKFSPGDLVATRFEDRTPLFKERTVTNRDGEDVPIGSDPAGFLGDDVGVVIFSEYRRGCSTLILCNHGLVWCWGNDVDKVA